VKLTNHLHLVPRSRKRGVIPPFPHYASIAWFSFKTQGQLHVYLSWSAVTSALDKDKAEFH
jgi:hypothetical protein